MLSIQPEKLDKFLPPTPCTDAMRKSIIAIAAKEGVSIAQVQRTAFEFFLSEIAKSSIIIDRESIIQEQS